jgi:osmotically-inducible protein OsmY
MKGLYVLLLMVTMACSHFVAKINNAIETDEKMYRSIAQISQDYKTDDLILALLKESRSSSFGLSKSKDIGNFEFYTFNNMVLLTGVVYDEKNADFISKIIAKAPAVTNIINELVVDPTLSRSSITDFFIKRAIESKVKVRFPMKALNYKFSVVNGNVFVVGIAEHEVELELLLKSISTIRGVREVISYATVNVSK